MELKNGRWFPKIVDRDSGNLYPIYAPFSCSDLCGGWCGGGGRGVKNKTKYFLQKQLFLLSCFLHVLCYFQHTCI